MTMELVVRGVPRALARDAWWFGAEVSGADDLPPDEPAGTRRGAQRPVFLLLALVAFADVLFWRHTPGLSLPVFAMAVFAAAAVGQPWRSVRWPLVLLGIAVLPAIEYVQLLSVLFLAAGLLAAIAWIHMPQTRRLGEIARRAAQLGLQMPLKGLRDLKSGLKQARNTEPTGRRTLSGALRTWGVPIGGTAVLIGLLLDANPILADWTAHAFDLDIDVIDLTSRALFWAGIAAILWPLVSAAETTSLPTPPMADRPIRRPFAPGLNAGSVLRALVLFNLVLGVQTVMDAALLWGEGQLPEGMSYAEYAHRGAYPLVAAALLAGGFALAARPFLDESRLLRPLVLLWLVQNVLLCLSSAKRLDLYVDAFGLTYLRVYVMIWIAVVGIALSLTAWQIWKRRANSWLLLRYTLLGVGVLYLSSFVNFAQVIARHNLDTGDRPLDWIYLASLPDLVNPTVLASDAYADLEHPVYRAMFALPDPIDGWRDWGFRRWRVEASIPQAEPKEAEGEDTGGR